jgi:hypothetical protein
MQVDQIDTVLASAFMSLRIAMDAGVRLGSADRRGQGRG